MTMSSWGSCYLALITTACVTVVGSFSPDCSAIPATLPWIDCRFSVQPQYGPLPMTGVNFVTSDNQTQTLFDKAEQCALGNTQEIAAGLDVLVEGGGYGAVWLETQPMGGATYGVRNMTLALNNQLIFMRTQRKDGRLPGMVTKNHSDATMVHPTYDYPNQLGRSMLQGFYMATPAVDLGWIMLKFGDSDKAHTYLKELQPVLEKFQAWLWSNRNSSDGVLWLHDTADTGEDGSDKYRSIPGNYIVSPYENMDMMGYAFDAQRALARIANLTGDQVAFERYQMQSEMIAAKLRERLWSNKGNACFDRMRDGNQSFVTTLVHNNIRAMWHGVFSQDMSDAFVSHHLMNTSEFWTKAPLPSISVSDPRFRNLKGNNWSGPPEGLTYQRAIRALHSYGHHAELLLVGQQQKKALFNTMNFPQQIDPFTAIPQAGHCYGPMLLSMLEYTALSTGIAVRPADGMLLWSNYKDRADIVFSFTQRLGSSVFTLSSTANGSFTGRLGNRDLFTCNGRTRVVTNELGIVRKVIGISTETEAIDLILLQESSSHFHFSIRPNEEYEITSQGPIRTRQVPFTPPF